MSNFPHAAQRVGKYLVSPMVRPADGGEFSASVSVKSGSGRGTHDRVLRLIGRFRTQETAQRHALAEGLNYLRPRFAAVGGLPACVPAAE